MDEVISYLLEELAMDGESGSDPERFLEFIRTFHRREHERDPAQPVQLVDEAYRDYVWACLSKNDSVSIGKRKSAAARSSSPQRDASNDAEQRNDVVGGSKKRKRPSVGSRGANPGRDLHSHIDTVDVVSPEQSESKSLSSLIQEFGASETRIVLDPDLVRLKLIGSSDKKALSGSLYGALQLCARAREKAITSTAIGQAMGFDQKTVFYFLKALIAKGLIVKFKSTETGTSNMVLLSRYKDENMAYVRTMQKGLQQSKSTANKASVAGEQDSDVAEDEDDDAVEDIEADGTEEPSSSANDDVPNQNCGEIVTRQHGLVAASTSAAGVQPIPADLEGLSGFAPISRTRAIAIASEYQLLETRLCQLIRASKSDFVPRHGLWERLGFPSAGVSLNGQLDSLVDGMIANGNIKATTVKNVACLQLTLPLDATESLLAGATEQQKRVEAQCARSEHTYLNRLSFERQVWDVIHNAGAKGVTTREIAASFRASRSAVRHFDEQARAFELRSGSIVNVDQRISSAIEMHGRERRIRFWTAGGVLRHAEDGNEIGFEEQVAMLRSLTPSSYVGLMEQSGAPDGSYGSRSELLAALNAAANLADVIALTNVKTSQKRAAGNQASSRPTKILKPGRPNKPSNPIDPSTGRPRKGRPRKSDAAPAVRTSTNDDNGQIASIENDGAEVSMAADAAPLSYPETTTVSETRQASDIAGQDTTTADNTTGDCGTAVASSHVQQVQSSTATPMDASVETQALPLPAEVTIKQRTPSPAELQPTSTTQTEVRPSTSRIQPSTGRVDASLQRRARLTLDVVTHYGGIVQENFLAELFSQYLALNEGQRLGQLAKGVGDLRDAKTRGRVLSMLERRGEVRLHTTALPNRKIGVKIIQLPTAAAEEVQNFIRRVQRGKNPSQEMIAQVQSTHGAALTTVWKDRNGLNTSTDALLATAPLQELLDNPGTRAYFVEDDTVRSGQYGLLSGVNARLRYIHIDIMRRLDADQEDRHGIVSVLHGDVDIDAYVDHMSLNVLVRIKPVLKESDALATALNDDETRRRPISEQPKEVKEVLGAQNVSQQRQWFKQTFLDRLTLMSLATAVADSRATSSTGLSMSLYRFKHANVDDSAWHWSGQAQGSGPMESAEDARRYWNDMQTYGGEQLKCIQKLVEADRSYPRREDFVALARAVRTSKKWLRAPQTTKRQAGFLRRIALEPPGGDLRQLRADGHFMGKLSQTIMLPVERIERVFNAHDPLPPKQRRAIEKARDGQLDADQVQSKKTLGQRRRRGVKRGHEPDLPMDDNEQMQQIQQAIFLQERTVEERRRRAQEWKENVIALRNELGLNDEQYVKLLDGLAEAREDFIDGKGLFQFRHIAAMARAAWFNRQDSKDRGRPRQSAPSVGTSDQDAVQTRARKRRGRGEMKWARSDLELLRDACVILTARDKARDSKRPNWTALKQIWPDHTAQSLRARFVQLAGVIGEEAYLAQLESEWTALWELWRGTAILPDEDPYKPNAFDLREHIDFLRNNIDKDAVLETVERAAMGDGLPDRVEDMIGDWRQRESGDDDHVKRFTALWESVVSNTIKEETVRGVPFTTSSSFKADTSADRLHTEEALVHNRVAETAVGMLIRTDERDIDETTSMSFIEGVGEEAVEQATRRLLDAKVIRRTDVEGRRKPSANFAFLEEPRRTYISGAHDTISHSASTAESHAELLQRLNGGDDSHEDDGDCMAVIGPDNDTGDTIAFAYLATSAVVEPAIEPQQLWRMAGKVFFNVKVITDRDNECIVTIYPGSSSANTLAVAKAPKFDDSESVSSWWPLPLNADITAAWARFTSKLDRESKQAVETLREDLEDAGSAGLPLSIARERLTVDPSAPIGTDLLKQLVSFCSQERPLLFVAGYQDLRIISSSHLSDWLVAVKPKDRRSSRRWVQPRSWFDARGTFIRTRWNAGLKQLLNFVHLRPGLTRATLCDLMADSSNPVNPATGAVISGGSSSSSNSNSGSGGAGGGASGGLFSNVGGGWDREEVRDLLRAAVKTGVVMQRTLSMSQGQASDPLTTGLCSDEDVEVLPTGRPWYQIGL
ncbi:unnamed protein product [Jaminaea pallidilutea]